MKCPKCNKPVVRDSASAMCVETYKECLDCRRPRITSAEISTIIKAHQKRVNGR